MINELIIQLFGSWQKFFLELFEVAFMFLIFALIGFLVCML